jgi:hypothetical protein
MADLKDGGAFLERGIGKLFNVRRKFLGIQRAPFPPARFGGERARLGGWPDTDKPCAAPGQSGGLPRLWSRRPEETSPPVPANPTHRLSCPGPTTLCANGYVICYRAKPVEAPTSFTASALFRLRQCLRVPSKCELFRTSPPILTLPYDCLYSVASLRFGTFVRTGLMAIVLAVLAFLTAPFNRKPTAGSSRRV